MKNNNNNSKNLNYSNNKDSMINNKTDCMKYNYNRTI